MTGLTRTQYILLIMLIGMALVATGYRLNSLTLRPLTWDELAVIRWGNSGFSSLVSQVAREDAHPPLSYLGQELFRRMTRPLVGRDVSLRIFSALCGLAGAVLLFFFARGRTDWLTALLAAVLLLLNPQHIHASSTGRMYSAAVMMILASLLLLERAAESGRRRDGVLAGLVTLSAALTHYYVLFVLPAILFFIPSLRYRHLVLPVSVLFWGLLPWALLASSSPLAVGGEFSGRLTRWLAVSPGAALVEGSRLLDFDLLLTGIPGLVLGASLLVSIFCRDCRPVSLSIVVPALILAVLSGVLHTLYGSWTLQGAQLVLLTPFLALLLARLATRWQSLRPLLIPALLVFAVLTCARYHAGQEALAGLNMLRSQLRNQVVRVATDKEATEVAVNIQARPLLGERPEAGRPIHQLQPADPGRKDPQETAPVLLINGDPDIRWIIPDWETTIRLDLPKISRPFLRRVASTGRITADGQQLLLDGPWPRRETIRIVADDPEWFRLLQIPGWLLLILLIAAGCRPTGTARESGESS